MSISAALVKELRERTGAGMMECKKALVEAGGDIEVAVDTMRKSGQAKADKRAGRVTAEGRIALASDAGGQAAAMVEVNCETDFVAKEDGFADFVQALATRALQARVADVDALLAQSFEEGGSATVDDRRRELVAKIGENVSIRRLLLLTAEDGQVGAYLHGGRIGVLVAFTGGNAEVAKDIAMHVAASRPVCLAEEDVPQDLISKEREILEAQAAESGKPAEIVAKMVEGRVNKFYKEITLLGQPFVKDPNLSVAQYLKPSDAQPTAFHRFEVGEGLEKRSENFAEEVMAQVQSAG